MTETLRDREEELEELHTELDRLQNQHEQDDVEMYKEEINKLKNYLNQLSQENEEMRRAQEQQDRLHVQEAMRNRESDEKENERPEEREPESPGTTPTRQTSSHSADYEAGSVKSNLVIEALKRTIAKQNEEQEAMAHKLKDLEWKNLDYQQQYQIKLQAYIANSNDQETLIANLKKELVNLNQQMAEFREVQKQQELAAFAGQIAEMHSNIQKGAGEGEEGR